MKIIEENIVALTYLANLMELILLLLVFKHGERRAVPRVRRGSGGTAVVNLSCRNRSQEWAACGKALARADPAWETGCFLNSCLCLVQPWRVATPGGIRGTGGRLCPTGGHAVSTGSPL